MANLILDYYKKTNNGYNEGSNSNILSQVQTRDPYDIISSENLDYNTAYHMSPLRANILRWYNFKKKASVLEIGAECGALTKTLCEKCEYVVSTDNSKINSTINYERHKKYSNLDIYVGDFNDIEFNQTFDYIVVNGSIPFSNYCSNDTKKHNKYLSKISSLLNEDGVLLLAIENRLGLKYFDGSAEPNYNTHFTGINGYSDEDCVHTYSKSEITNLLHSIGFTNLRFFYPYPDYIFPMEIFSDKTIETMGYGRPINHFENNRLAFFNAEKIFSLLSAEKTIKNFANSFFIEAKKTAFNQEEWPIYVKLSNDRKPIFSIYTSIYENSSGELSVYKYAENPSAKQHIENILVNSKNRQGNIKSLEGTKVENGVKFNYIKTNNLDKEIYKQIKNNDLDVAFTKLDSIISSIRKCEKDVSDYMTEEFIEVFGTTKSAEHYKVVSRANIDYILDNLYNIGEEYLVIDCEWIFNFDIPSKFIIWRMLNEFVSKHSISEKSFSRKLLMKRYNINAEDEDVFYKWSVHFAQDYVGTDTLKNLYKQTLPINLDKENCLETCLYLDLGEGFNEINCIRKDIITKSSGEFIAKYDISKYNEIKALRWDPTNESCIIYNCEIYADNEKICDASNNAKTNNKSESIFYTDDPMYVFSLENPKTSIIEIKGTYKYIDNEYFIQQEKITDSIISDFKNQSENLKAQIEHLNDEVKEQQNKLSNITNSRAWRITLQMKKIANIFKNTTKTKEIEKQDGPILVKKGSSYIENLTINHYIDWYYSNYGLIDLTGWIFSPQQKIKSLYILLDNGVQKKTISAKITERPDVKKIHNLSYENIGIETSVTYSSCCGGTTFLGVIFENDDEYIIPIGTFEKTKLFGELCIGLIGERTRFETYKNEIHNFSNYSPSRINGVFDIIIPVYNGFEYFDGLFKSIKKTNCNYHVYIVDDCSSDERVLPYLKEYAAHNSNVTLIQNNENLGFVKSVNKALKLSNNDVIIVNTDVVLPQYWLERIVKPIKDHKEIATVTPFTNSGTICSFPNFCENNDIYLNRTIEEIDQTFSKVSPSYTIVPTGVGFCMAMSRTAINTIGFFDDETFNKGYGEENDWCQRAIKAGFINVITENLFVWHKHGGSFLSEDKKRFLKENEKKLLNKHPQYNNDVGYYFRSDPHKHIRNCIKWFLAYQHQEPYYLALDHDWGGGANLYLYNEIDKYNQQGFQTIILKYNIGEGLYLELNCNKTTISSLYFNSLSDIEIFVKNFNIKKIIVNELISFKNIVDIQQFILKEKKKLSCDVLYLVHDFYCICPSMYLLDNTNQHCWFANLEKCNECCINNKNNNKFAPWNDSITNWRENWGNFLHQCDEIRVFSNNSKKYLEYYYGELCYEVVPHKVDYIEPIKQVQNDDIITIAIIGNFMFAKGADLVCEMSNIIKERNINARIIVIGDNTDKYKCENIEFYGSYERENLGRILEDYNTDIIAITSICPETFSYTTEEAMALNLPVACYNIGAPAERISKYQKGIIVEKLDAINMLDEILKYFSNSN
ncbi:MAG: glycosyltransferase [Lachnospiraceae bacterium]|nr:glycosyltransferase [Lachnospiraceae bacterium]